LPPEEGNFKKLKSARGNPAGRPRGTRNQLTEAVVCALLRDFRLHGQKAIARVRRENPSVYLRVLGMLVPREARVEHVDPITQLSDEMLETLLVEMQGRLEKRADRAKLVNADERPALPQPAQPAK
jgi:hypothetical protein